MRIDTEKRRRHVGIALVLAGVAALLGGMIVNVPLLIVSGAAFTVGGAMMCFAKVSGTVVITTRGREVRAVTSKDAALIQSVAAALRDAIASRGS